MSGPTISCSWHVKLSQQQPLQAEVVQSKPGQTPVDTPQFPFSPTHVVVVVSGGAAVVVGGGGTVVVTGGGATVVVGSGGGLVAGVVVTGVAFDVLVVKAVLLVVGAVKCRII